MSTVRESASATPSPQPAHAWSPLRSTSCVVAVAVSGCCRCAQAAEWVPRWSSRSSSIAQRVPAMRVGFIGLGSQGGPMAVAIHEAGFALQVWARRDAVRDEFRSRGVTVAESPRALAQRCDVVCICVTGDEDVHGLVREEGMLAAMAQESVLVIHSTVSPALCERLAAVGAERGVVVVDAPVSGGGD